MNLHRTLIPTVDLLEIERINLLRFRVAADQEFSYCAVINERDGDNISTAIVYRVGHNSPFPSALEAIIGYLHRELWPKRAITQIGLADVGFGLDLARNTMHQVRTGQRDSNGAISWTDADLRTQRFWEDRTRAAVEVLLRLGA